MVNIKLTLQKIMYMAHMYNLGINNDPIVTGHFQAWDYGPVHPEVYHYVKVFGSKPIGDIFRSIKAASKGPETDMLDEAVE